MHQRAFLRAVERQGGLALWVDDAADLARIIRAELAGRQGAIASQG